MTLTEEDLREFAAIWSDEFEETIPEKEAGIAASLLLELLPAARPNQWRSVTYHGE